MRYLLILWLILTVLMDPLPTAAQPPDQSTSNEADQERLVLKLLQCPELTNLITSPDWRESLSNPVLRSTVKVDSFVRAVYTVHSFLERLENDLTQGELPSYSHLPEGLADMEYVTGQLCAYFGVQSGGRYIPIDLATTDDQAIRALRQEAGLRPPRGLVFQVHYLTPHTVPPELASAFSDHHTIGVTMYCRYTVLLRFASAPGEPTLVPMPTFIRAVSHELVHAYINSLLGERRKDDLPKWFHEGVAIHLSYSGRSPTSTDTEEYRMYRQGFEFLERKLGRKRLLHLIGLAVRSAAPDSLLQAAGTESFMDIIEFAKQDRQRRWWDIGMYITLSFMALVFLGWARDRRLAKLRMRLENNFGVSTNSRRQFVVAIKGYSRPVQIYVFSESTIIATLKIKNPSIPTTWSGVDKQGHPLPAGEYCFWLEVKSMRFERTVTLT